MPRVVLPLLLMGLVAACAQVPDTLPPAPQVPVPIAASAMPPYQIRVGDVLDVRLLLNPELNEEVTVRPDGRISTAIAHDAVAAGLTIPQLDHALDRDYARVTQHTDISVVVRAVSPIHVFVAGEVARPGEFSTTGPALTLSEAIASAGGTKLSSDDNRVFIIRHTATGGAEFLATDYGAVIHARKPTADVVLAPYDVVYVSKLGIAEVYKWYYEYIGQFANPSVGFSYIINQPATGTTVLAPR